MSDGAPLIFEQVLGALRPVSPPPASELRELLHYEPETGKLFWKYRSLSFFSLKAHQSGWNKRYAGVEAFTPLNGNRYRSGSVLCYRTTAHRVIWAIIYGGWPAEEIDHINGDRQDNRLSNLRAVTKALNQRNRGLSTNNKSGITGVTWNRQKGKWTAQIKEGGRQVHLGTFVSITEAAEARRAAERRIGYHVNHGFAR